MTRLKNPFLLAFFVTVAGIAQERSLAQDPFAPRVVVSRWTMAHGRVDDIRSKGLANPANPKGEAVPGFATLIGEINKQTNPQRITLALDKEGMLPAGGKPNAVVLAAGGLPSGMSLAVFDLPAGEDDFQWKPMAPRFGNGNLYATVSIPGKKIDIVAGQELRTAEHFKAYTANSVIYEAPDFGKVVVSHALVGGTVNIMALIGVKRPKDYSRRIGYSQPLKMELTEERQTRTRVGEIQIWLRADFPASFETGRTIRVAAETRKGTFITDVPAAVKAGVKVNRFSVTVPADTEGLVKISAVASPGPFFKALPAKPQTVGLETFQSKGPTLEDTLSAQVRPLTEKIFNGQLTKANPLDKKRKGCHAVVYPFKMEKGATYLIDLESFKGSYEPKNPAFFDTWVRIEDAAGKELDANDDGGEGYNARLAFTAPASGEFRIIVTSFRAGSTGTYVLRIRY